MSLNIKIDLSGVSTKSKHINVGDYLATIDKLEVMPNKAQTGSNLLVMFKVVGPTTSLDAAANGETNDMPNGAVLRKYYPLQQSENAKAPDFRVDLCRLIDAAYSTNDDTRPDLSDETLNGLLGRSVMLTTRLARPTPDYPDASTEIGKISVVNFG
jgi:hypothetical protein